MRKNFFHFTMGVWFLGTSSSMASGLDVRGQLMRRSPVEFSHSGVEATHPELVSPDGGRGLRVFLDAGHGGRDLGAPGERGVLEKDVVLQIAQLMDRGFPSAVGSQRLEIQLSRVRDLGVPLRQRARMANAWGADVFVSIHANSSPFRYVQGFEVYFLSQDATDADAHVLAQFENAVKKNSLSTGVLSILSDLTTTIRVGKSSDFAQTVYESMEKQLKSNRRGVRQAPFTVLSETQMPALLVEVGYLTHPQEARRLEKSAYLTRVAQAINSGVIRFLSNQKKTL